MIKESITKNNKYHLVQMLPPSLPCGIYSDLVGSFLQQLFVGTQTRAQTPKGIGRSQHHRVANLLCCFQGFRYLKDAHKHLKTKYVYILCLKVHRKKMILTDSTAKLGAIFSLISFSLSEKSCLSSVAMMDSTGVPRTFTPYFSRTPLWNNSTPEHKDTGNQDK